MVSTMTTTQRNLHKLFIVQGFIMWHMTVKLFRWAKCSDYIYLPHVKSIDAWLPVHKIWLMKQFLQMNPPPLEGGEMAAIPIHSLTMLDNWPPPKKKQQLVKLRNEVCRCTESILPDKVWDIYFLWGLPVTLLIIITIWLNISDNSLYHMRYKEIWKEKQM